MNRKKSIPVLLLVGILTSCSSPPDIIVESSNSDFTLLLPVSPMNSGVFLDLNDHPSASSVEESTGKQVDYISFTAGNESTELLMMMSTKNLPHGIRMDLEKEYFGGVEEAIYDEMIIDITDLVAENAPNFMEYLESDQNLRKSAFNDWGTLTKFGAVLTEEELRGLPYYGPVINKSYLDEVGLEIPETLAHWEEILLAFQKIGVKSPLSLGLETDLSSLYHCFASSFGVGAGSTFFQEDGTVKFSPLEEGYYDFICLLKDWYEKGLLDSEFSKNTYSDDNLEDFYTGKVGAVVTHTNVALLAELRSESTDTPMEFVQVPYPVLEEGDVVKFRHYTPDFTGSPVFIHSQANNPVEIIQWVDFFYGEEGKTLSNWGTLGETYEIDQSGQKKFLDSVLNSETSDPAVVILAQEVLQENSVLRLWDYEQQFYQDSRQTFGWDVWSLATYENMLPETLTFTVDEQKVFASGLDILEKYVHESTLAFITGQRSLSQYETFLKTMEDLRVLEYISIYQNAFDRYGQR